MAVHGVCVQHICYSSGAAFYSHGYLPGLRLQGGLSAGQVGDWSPSQSFMACV